MAKEGLKTPVLRVVRAWLLAWVVLVQCGCAAPPAESSQTLSAKLTIVDKSGDIYWTAGNAVVHQEGHYQTGMITPDERHLAAVQEDGTLMVGGAGAPIQKIDEGFYQFGEVTDQGFNYIVEVERYPLSTVESVLSTLISDEKFDGTVEQARAEMLAAGYPETVGGAKNFYLSIVGKAYNDVHKPRKASFFVPRRYDFEMGEIVGPERGSDVTDVVAAARGLTCAFVTAGGRKIQVLKEGARQPEQVARRESNVRLIDVSGDGRMVFWSEAESQEQRISYFYALDGQVECFATLEEAERVHSIAAEAYIHETGEAALFICPYDDAIYRYDRGLGMRRFALEKPITDIKLWNDIEVLSRDADSDWDGIYTVVGREGNREELLYLSADGTIKRVLEDADLTYMQICRGMIYYQDRAGALHRAALSEGNLSGDALLDETVNSLALTPDGRGVYYTRAQTEGESILCFAQLDEPPVQIGEISDRICSVGMDGSAWFTAPGEKAVQLDQPLSGTLMCYHDGVLSPIGANLWAVGRRVDQKGYLDPQLNYFIQFVGWDDHEQPNYRLMRYQNGKLEVAIEDTKR